MTVCIGVDGCPAGWLAVLWRLAPDRRGHGTVEVSVCQDFAALLEIADTNAAEAVAIDIPIGLADRIGPGGRHCDTSVRAVLGARQSSVFAIPSRDAVMQSEYRRACARALATSDPPRKVSRQAFNLFSKIRDVDRSMTPERQKRIFECHPEAAFWAMNDRQPLSEPKKVKSRPFAPGLELRRRLLTEQGVPLAAIEAQAPAGRIAGPDDLLDAAACAWSARRFVTGDTVTFPDNPALDRKGLRMEIRV